MVYRAISISAQVLSKYRGDVQRGQLEIKGVESSYCEV
jgi:hypothetical protein